MIVELFGGPFDGEILEIEEVEHNASCAPDCDVPEVEIHDDDLNVHATYARCAVCGMYEYIWPDDDEMA